LLAYLDMLCAALLARESWEIRRLLKHPLARVLPRRVREEAYAIARLGTSTKRAPIHTLNFYHQTVQLLGTHSEPAATESAATTEPAPVDTAQPAAEPDWVREAGPVQLELPLRAAGGG
jgi:hypothetical protein